MRRLHTPLPRPSLQELSDQDAIIMNQQEVRIRKGGLRPTNYYLVSPGADNGVAAINRCHASML